MKILGLFYYESIIALLVPGTMCCSNNNEYSSPLLWAVGVLIVGPAEETGGMFFHPDMLDTGDGWHEYCLNTMYFWVL